MVRAALVLALVLATLTSCVSPPAAVREHGAPGPGSAQREIPEAGGAGGGGSM